MPSARRLRRAVSPHIPEPLRTHRIAQAMAFIVHAAADRERTRVERPRRPPVRRRTSPTCSTAWSASSKPRSRRRSRRPRRPDLGRLAEPFFSRSDRLEHRPDDAVAVITGAGSGIGRAAARSLAARGARVVVTDIDGDRADHGGRRARRRRPSAAHVRRHQPRRPRGRPDLALDRFGRIDVVMNNVGILAVGAVEDIPLEAWQRVVDINLLGVVRSNLVFLPLLLAQGSGHVVNTASTAGLLPYGFDRLPYTATKHAVVGLSESLALYLRPRGIGVTCLCPAGVATNILEQITLLRRADAARGPSFPVVDAGIRRRARRRRHRPGPVPAPHGARGGRRAPRTGRRPRRLFGPARQGIPMSTPAGTRAGRRAVRCTTKARCCS